MDKIMHAFEWLKSADGALLFMVLFGISESLASIPAIKANSVFGLVYGLLKKLAGK